MRTLRQDVETYSGSNLKTDGVYKYVKHPDFGIMLWSYAFDDDPVQCLDLFRDPIPQELIDAQYDPEVTKLAWNSQFEFNTIGETLLRSGYPPLIQEQWQCTMVAAANVSLPLGLDQAAAALGLSIRKDPAGRALINYFCIPVKNPKKADGYRTRNYHYHRPDRWELFLKYCPRDVEVERAIGKRIERVSEITAFERSLYHLDQKINARGIKVDLQLVHNAIEIDEKFKNDRIAEAQRITGLHNPKSVDKLKKWLTEEMELDEEIEKLRKDDVVKLLKGDISDKATRVLQIRQELSKTSVSKYIAMRCGASDTDHRIRGLFQFYGASRTGRWAGRQVQMQNLPRGEYKAKIVKLARKALRNNDVDTLIMLFGESLPNTLSQLIRPAFIPEAGHEFICADYSQIESRVLAWLAGELWRIQAFERGDDIYKVSARLMFHLDPLEDVTDEFRQRGKVAELALGYGGSIGALTTMDIKKKLKEAEKRPLVDAWRAANPRIVAYWSRINETAMRVIRTGIPERLGHGMSMKMNKGVFYIVLPSGRSLKYLKPHIGTNKFGGDGIFYKGQDQKTGKWSDLETYGGKLVENIVQAVSRDILAEAMVALDKEGHSIVMHVHDEAVIESPIGRYNPEDIASIMKRPIAWAKGLPLDVKAFTSQYYVKD